MQTRKILARPHASSEDLEILAVALVRRQGDPDWPRRAACQDSDAELFFDEDNARGPFLERRQRAAKQICARCPVIESCLSWSLLASEKHGVWGGMTASERGGLLRRETERRAG
jgi:WhiB family transcriptional regulator, redox-sensing transcriptional regulator